MKGSFVPIPDVRYLWLLERFRIIMMKNKIVNPVRSRFWQAGLSLILIIQAKLERLFVSSEEWNCP